MTYIRIFPLTKEPIQDPRGGWVNFTDVSIDTNPKFQYLLTSHDFVILNQADELTALRAENAKLREALKPFTQIPVMEEEDSHPINTDGFILAYHVRKARRALESHE